MTLESTLERIAIALETIAKQGEALTCVTPVEPQPAEVVTPVAEEKKPAKKKTKKEEPKVEEPKVEEPTLAETVTKEIVQEVVPEIKKDLTSVLNDCKLKATELMQQVGRDVATLYINEVTAQVTGIENARLKDCNLAQAEAVLDAIEAKLNTPNDMEGIV